MKSRATEGGRNGDKKRVIGKKKQHCDGSAQSNIQKERERDV